MIRSMVLIYTSLMFFEMIQNHFPHLTSIILLSFVLKIRYTWRHVRKTLGGSWGQLRHTNFYGLAIPSTAAQGFTYVTIPVDTCKSTLNVVCALTGPEKVKVLPLFHAFTGCDTVSSFKSTGKKSAIEAWTAFPNVTNGFLAAYEGNIKEAFYCVEKLVITLYDRFLCVCWRVQSVHAQLNNDIGKTSLRSPHLHHDNSTIYAWTAWGSWSPCSKTCGGGVAVQERQCLPRDPVRWRRSRKRRKMTTTSTERYRREVRSVINIPGDENCAGLARRYHECNTSPCPGAVNDPRAEQCAYYDLRPFKGRFYTWVPYVDGKNQCVLNCRPRGQQFYASLSLVVDGTPCTKPGFRAICVQGTCQAIGREGVLAAATTREVRCGRRLVAGLFSKPRLPLGYSYVTTVPRGACRLNISEIASSDNYIALKAINGSYIINGDFAVSAPGLYDAAGTRFHYTRHGGLDKVYAHGPTQHSIDIMLLYTQPNPSLKYEYFTDSDTNEISNDIPSSVDSGPTHHLQARHHRHHSGETFKKSLDIKTEIPVRSPVIKKSEEIPINVIGDRKFTWKIVNFTQCSRTCGGGLQVGKFRCVELINEGHKEVSPAHCAGSPPASKRRRCGGAQCAPRWRAAPWGPCPVCGPAHRTRIVGCVQDHARGITKVSDQKCPLPMPANKELCDIPNCDGTEVKNDTPRTDSRRQVRPKEGVEAFRDAPIISLTSNASLNHGSDQSFSFSGVGGWLYTEWSECVGQCVGGGIQSRGVRCGDPSGCAPRRAPSTSQTCTARIQCSSSEGQWFTSDWSKCSASCGGRQIRGILCIGGNGRRLKESSCKTTKPEQERACGESCSPSWYISDWSECQGPCEAGLQKRSVWCAGADTSGALKDSACGGSRPIARRSCVPKHCTSAPRPPSLIHPSVSNDPQQRVTRHHSRHPDDLDIKERSFTGPGICSDKLSNCALAVQARLCHYHYYAEYCCRSCQKR